MSKLTVLATGMGGRIGPHLLPSFRERYDLRVLDKNPIPDFPDTILADLSDPEVLEQALQNVDVLVHLAATSDEAPFIEQLVPNNIIGLYHIFEAARRANVRRIVYASTIQTVSSNPGDNGPILPTDPPRPGTTYAVTKLFGENLGRWYHDKHHLEFVGVRIGWFQPYDTPFKGNDSLKRIWLSPRDCAGLLQAAIEKENVGYGVVFATSLTTEEFVSRAPARDLLGYESQDQAADYL